MIKKLIKRNGDKYALLAALLVLVIGITGCQNSDIVAKIDNETITKDELYDVLVEQGGEKALGALISEKIVDLEVKKQKIKVTDEEVEKEIEKMKENYGGEEAFNMTIMQYGLDEESLKENVTMNLKIKKLLEPEISISDEEISDYFKENKDMLGEPEQVDARHILVETEEQAKDIREKLEAGEDFEKLAKEHSMDQGSKEAGGELGVFGKGEMVKEFEEAAFTLKPHEISEPIKTEHGYHIIEVLEKKETKEAKFEDVKDDIKEILLQQKISTEYGNWYQKKLEEYKVKDYLTDK